MIAAGPVGDIITILTKMLGEVGFGAGLGGGGGFAGEEEVGGDSEVAGGEAGVGEVQVEGVYVEDTEILVGA